MGDRRDGTRLKSGGFEKIWNCLKSIPKALSKAAVAD